MNNKIEFHCFIYYFIFERKSKRKRKEIDEKEKRKKRNFISNFKTIVLDLSDI